MLTKIAADGVKAPSTPTVPNFGRSAGRLSAPNAPVTVYALPTYRMTMATAVYNIPKLPTKEKGAKDDKFFIKHNGKRMVPVKPSVTGILDEAMPTVDNKLTKVSPRIIEYAKQAKHVLKVTAVAGTQLVDSETVALHASR